MAEQLRKSLSFCYAIGIPRHIRSLRTLVCEWDSDNSFSGMDMALVSGLCAPCLLRIKLTRMLALDVNAWQQPYELRGEW